MPPCEGDRAGAPTASPMARSLVTGLALTAVSWTASRFVVAFFSARAKNPFSFLESSWVRWDSVNYYQIAAHGQAFYPCGATWAATHGGMQWCGSAVWLPGYPGLMRLGGVLGSPNLMENGIVISALATAGALFLVWWGWLRGEAWYTAALVMILFGVFPGAVYDFAVFPMSVTLLLLVGALVAAVRSRLLVMTACLVGAGLCYPLAWPAAGGIAAGLVILALGDGARATVKAALFGLLGLASVAVLGVYYQAVLGRFDAYFVIARESDLSGFAAGLHSTITIVFHHRGLIEGRLGRTGRMALPAQIVLATGLVATSGLAAALERSRATVLPAMAGMAVFGGVLLSSSHADWYRSIVLAAPCVLALRRLPTVVLCGIVVAVAFTTALLSRGFFSGALI